MPLSTKQCEYLALAWQCFESEPKIDYEKFREVAGLKTAASARELMRVTKNKLKDEYGALSGSITASNAATTNSTPKKNGGGTPKTPASGTKRARGGKKAKSEVESEGGSEEGGSEGSPSKKVKKSNGVKVEEEGEDGEEGGYELN